MSVPNDPGRRPDEPGDEPFLMPIEEPSEYLTPEGLRAGVFRTVDGAYSDDLTDPAMIPVIEAGGGVSEGFEQAEALLVDHATEGDPEGMRRILRDAFPAEAGEEHGVYGEADEEASSERTDR